MRTKEMHQFAEYGIAAHWRYKEGHLALSKSDIQKISKLRALFEAAKEIQDPAEFLETVKVDLFSNEIFVFTPKGDIKIFPQQATALDFAYAVHTEVGNHCTGAFANGKMVPLRYVLQNGDRISVQTSPSQSPKRAWLDIVRTGRAISKIRHYIREEERQTGIVLGKEILEKEVLKNNHTLAKLLKTGKLQEAYKPLGFKQPEHLYLSISSGAISLSKITKALFPETQKPAKSVISSFISKIRSKPISPVTVGGKQNVLTAFARCCSPLPGEPITGFITRGKGISIHRSDCAQLLHSDAFLRIEVEWQHESESAHTTALEIICSDQMGILADLGAVCKTKNINVIRMDGRASEDNRANLYLEVIIKNVASLNTLIRTIRKISGVLQVRRITTKNT
jgi:GTP pyrophosphokinase